MSQVYTKNGSNGYVMKLTLDEVATDVTNNTSKVKYILQLVAPNSAHFSQITTKYNVKLNGTYQVNKSEKLSISRSETKTLATGYTTITHASDGSKTISVAFGGSQTASYGIGNIAYTGGTFALTTLNRKAVMNKANDFTDESAVIYRFTNKGGYVTEPFLQFLDTDNSTVLFNLDRYGTPISSGYKWTLTAAEKNTIYGNLGSVNSCKCRAGIRTTISGTHYYSYVTVTFSIINAKPVITVPGYCDANSSVLAITGNDQMIVQGLSNLQVDCYADTVKGASLSSASCTVNGKTVTAAVSGTHAVPIFTFNAFNGSSTIKAKITITDSRGNKASTDVTITCYAYAIPNAVVKLERLNNYEDTTHFKVDGKCSGVGGTNTMVIDYRVKENGGSYGSWTTINDNVQYTLTYDKNKEYIFNVRIKDSYSTVAGSYYNKTFTLPKGKFPLFIDTGMNAVSINDFPASGEALRVKEGKANFLGGIQVNSVDMNDFIIKEGSLTNNGYTWYYKVYKGGLMEAWARKDGVSVTFSGSPASATVSTSLPSSFGGYVYNYAYLNEGGFHDLNCWSGHCIRDNDDLKFTAFRTSTGTVSKPVTFHFVATYT